MDLPGLPHVPGIHIDGLGAALTYSWRRFFRSLMTEEWSQRRRPHRVSVAGARRLAECFGNVGFFYGNRTFKFDNAFGWVLDRRRWVFVVIWG